MKSRGNSEVDIILSSEMVNQCELSQALSVLLKMQPRGKLAQYMEKVTDSMLWAFKNTGQTQSLSLNQWVRM